MKTESEFRAYYEQNIVSNPEMALSIGQFRLKIRRLRSGFIGALIICSFLFYAIDKEALPVIVPVFIILFIAISIFFDGRIRNYKKKYYQGIYRKIIGFFDNLTYNPDTVINEHTMEISELVNCPEDAILHKTEGSIDGNAVKICILSIPEERNNTTVIVNTLFMTAGFNMEIHGKTIVNSDDTEQKITRYLEIKKDPEYQQIRLEDVAFNKKFVVHSSHPEEARNILTPAMMQSILQIRDEFKITPEISFIGAHIFILYKLNDPYLDALLNLEVNYEDVLGMFKAYNTGLEILKRLNPEHNPGSDGV